MPRVVREYRPRRFVASVERHAAPLDAMTGDSFDWLVDSQEQAAYRRLGSAIAGGESSSTSPVGLLEDKWSPRARQMIELHSLSLTDGYPTYACLFTNESTILGTVYARSTNSTGYNYQLGKEFGSTHYPATAGGGTIPLWKCYPLWSENATTSYFRGCSATQRKLFASGARRMLEVGDWLYIPANTGMPIRWNRRWNDATGSGTEPNRIQPWGRQPPLFAPNLDGVAPTTAAAGSDSNWLDGDCFYVSVMFEFSDGSFSAPWIPRPKGTNGLTAAQAGLMEVGTIAGGNKYKNLNMVNLPLGPDDCVARWVLTSPKQTLAASTDTLTIEPLDLRVAEIVRNNTSTKFKLFGPGEEVDDLRVRFDHKWAWRAQVACGADQRVIIGGKMKPNPAAIILAPTGFAASRDYNVADNFAVGNNWCLARVSGTSLQLRYLAAVPGDPTATTTTITLTSAKTLQDIVDEINATVYTGVAQEWAAQVVPGTDPGIISTYLADTTTQRGGAAATDAWGDDTGIVNAGGIPGHMRCWHHNLPGILYLNDTYLAQFPADRQRIEFTGGGPGSPPSVANNFYVNNFRYPPNRGVGDFVGAASITPTAGITAIVCYERGIYSFRNIRGGGTGEDNDYRLLPINESRGCISYSSIIAGNGWVGYMTRDGFVITDGEREVLTSLDLWNAEKAGGAGVGIWQYEVNQSVAAVSKGGDDTYFHAMVSGSQVRVNYRATSSSSTQGNRGIQYDFSGSPASNGIQEVVQPDGSPFGWSCPIRQSFGPMCRISKSTGWVYYAAVEAADSTFSAGSGRIDQFNTGTNDNSQQINSPMYLATDLCDSMKKKSAVNVGLLFSNADSGLTCRVYRGPSRSNYSDLVLGTGSDIFTRKLVPLPAAARSRGDSVEIRITDDGSGTSSPTPKIWTAWLEVDVLDSDD